MNDAFTYQCLFTFMILLKNTFMILLKKMGKLTFIYCFYLLCIKTVSLINGFGDCPILFEAYCFFERNVLFSFITASVFQILKSQFEDCKERVKTFERM